LDLAPNKKVERKIDIALEQLVGFGGTNASVIFGKGIPKWRIIASNAVTFLILGLFLLGGLFRVGRGQYDAPGTYLSRGDLACPGWQRWVLNISRAVGR